MPGSLVVAHDAQLWLAARRSGRWPQGYGRRAPGGGGQGRRWRKRARIFGKGWPGGRLGKGRARTGQDRFGPLPDATRALIDCHRLRILGKPLGIARIDASENAIQLHFVPNPPIEPIKIIKLIQSKKNYKLAGQDRLRIDIKTPDLKTRVAEIRRVFTELG